MKYILFTTLVFYVFVLSVSKAKETEPDKLFDPYAILNVTTESTFEEIKYNYRKLML